MQKRIKRLEQAKRVLDEAYQENIDLKERIYKIEEQSGFLDDAP